MEEIFFSNRFAILNTLKLICGRCACIAVYFVFTADAIKQQLVDNVKKQLARSASKDKQLSTLEELVSVSQWSNLTPTLIGKLANIQKCR